MAIDPNDPLNRYIRKLIERGVPPGNSKFVFVLREAVKAIFTAVAASIVAFIPHLVSLVFAIMQAHHS